MASTVFAKRQLCVERKLPFWRRIPRELDSRVLFEMCRIVEHLLIAADRLAANFPLQVSLYSAVEIVKVAWAEVTAACVRNCFRIASFFDVVPDAEPDASEENQSSGNLGQRVVISNMRGHDIGWDYFISADKDADIVEPCTDKGAICEVWAESNAEESDDVETSEPAPITTPVAMGYIYGLGQLVYAKRLSEDHTSALNKLESAFIRSTLQKQTSTREFIAKQ
ncbi:hypothetical protein HPB49_001088 [Dermacentor silvarum]|uniref:Uncharacterized protein n=1 Tax=Dermacentor silvarum TaxID=543639 RepID=A0ACB8D9Z5_DERSI|nr:hypothetical protein HPB49_001088 [Dermacentor silvarum]